jgi:MOSC domain-containing protein YiiM
MSNAPTTTGRVIGLHVLSAHGERPQPRSEVRALVGQGLEGDLHGKGRAAGTGRQVLLMDRQTLEASGLGPGDLREQITVEFAALEDLPAGTRLRLGGAVLEVTGPCEPCTHIGKLNGRSDVVEFKKSLEGRRGQLARVVAVDGDGMIRLGDPVRHA